MTSGQNPILSLANTILMIYNGKIENRMRLSLILLKILKNEMRQ